MGLGRAGYAQSPVLEELVGVITLLRFVPGSWCLGP